jgi:amino acid transporter
MAAVKPPKKALGITSIGLMTAAAVVTSLRGLPLLAKEEMTMFAYLAFTVIFFLIPASLVSAELGGAFANKKGGIYAWVAAAFGSRWGFLAIWLQWIQNVVWYPVALTFGAAALAYTIGRTDLANNGVYVGIFCIVVYWLATFVVLQGVDVRQGRQLDLRHRHHIARHRAGRAVRMVGLYGPSARVAASV